MRHDPWTATIWYRVPRSLTSKTSTIVLATAVLLSLALPGLYALTHAATVARALARTALNHIAQSPTLGAAIAGMDPARRAALPQRLESGLLAMVPKLALLATAGSAVCAISVFLAAGWVRRVLVTAMTAEAPEGTAHTRPLAMPLVERALVAAAGAAVHLPFLRHSLAFDEAAAALHATRGYWSWADTTLGYHNHVGGELSIRLATALLGSSELSVRLPAVLCSSAGLVILYGLVRDRYRTNTAIVSAALVLALPLWAEQATLARGYGLLFFAGALALSALLELLEGRDPTRAIPRLALGCGLGLLAHPFFLFFVAATCGLLAFRATASRAAALAWIALAILPAIALYAPGIPATLYMSKTAGRGSFPVIFTMFGEELGFRFAVAAMRWAALALLTACWIAGLRRLPRAERRTVLILVAVALMIPILMRPAYLYPRFFIGLLPLLFPAAIPLGQFLDRHRTAGTVAAVALAALLWALPRPWAIEPVVDLRGAARTVRDASRPGERIAVDNFLTGLAFYDLGATAVFVSTDRDGVPADVSLFVRSFTLDQPARLPTGFVELARLPGRESYIVIGRRSLEHRTVL